jgi:hypothetical protein
MQLEQHRGPSTRGKGGRSLRRKSFHHGDTEDTELSFSMEFFSVISVPPWLIFIPMGR